MVTRLKCTRCQRKLGYLDLRCRTCGERVSGGFIILSCAAFMSTGLAIGCLVIYFLKL